MGALGWGKGRHLAGAGDEILHRKADEMSTWWPFTSRERCTGFYNTRASGAKSAQLRDAGLQKISICLQPSLPHC